MRILGSATRSVLATAALAAATVGVALLAPPTAQADSTHPHPTWDQRVVTVKTTVSTTWGVGAAVRQWNEHRVDGQPVLVISNDATDPDVVIGSVRRPDKWWTGMARGTVAQDGSLARFEISLNRSRIQDAGYRFEGSLHAAKFWTTSHELGHALGLEHAQQVQGSVMSYDNRWWRTEGQPSGFDDRQLALIY